MEIDPRAEVDFCLKVEMPGEDGSLMPAPATLPRFPSAPLTAPEATGNGATGRSGYSVIGFG
ncbi:MAG: hypothetical protein ABR615_03620 [Pseudonocardiaceae bacterium]